jgi:hypothetical protein
MFVCAITGRAGIRTECVSLVPDVYLQLCPFLSSGKGELSGHAAEALVTAGNRLCPLTQDV